jgi:TfoX/Sxy family transcriptional regulator of competence genes
MLQTQHSLSYPKRPCKGMIFLCAVPMRGEEEMPYDAHLEGRIDAIISDLEKRKMFGGICYFVRGNICFGIWKDSLIVRLGADATQKALKQKAVKEFDITGRPMAGWVMVDPPGCRTKAQLEKWLQAGRSFAGTLPPKYGR